MTNARAYWTAAIKYEMTFVRGIERAKAANPGFHQDLWERLAGHRRNIETARDELAKLDKLEVAKRSYSVWCETFPSCAEYGQEYRVAFGSETHDAWRAGLTTREYLDTLPVYCPVYADGSGRRPVVGHCPA